MRNESNNKINYINSHKSLFLGTTELIEMESSDIDNNNFSFEDMSEIFVVVDNSMVQNRKVKRIVDYLAIANHLQ